MAERDDYESLVSLSENEGWNYEVEDFLIMERSGCSKTLVADHGEIIGMITLFDYGEIGWISNLVVEEEWRKKGVGRSLLIEGIRTLGNKRTIALFSTEESLPFYLKSGLVADRDFYFVRFLGGEVGTVSRGEWSDSIEQMDTSCFGYRRGRLLKLLAESGSIVYPGDRDQNEPQNQAVEGFAILHPGAKESTVGPVISEDRDFLYSAMGALGIGSTAVTPFPNPRYTETVFKVTLMYLGEKPKINLKKAMAFAGLEYG
ncbi:MAG: GNAT family N-acetyltransferase [Candidatus Methanomethylicaceae archaeon]